MSEPNDPYSPQDNRLPSAGNPSGGAGESSLPVPVTGAAGLSPAVSSSGSAVRPDILTAPPKPLDLLRSLQRRWLLALVLGLMLGIPAAVITWFVVPVEYTSQAYLRFHETGIKVVDMEDDRGRRRKDPLQTHIELIQSRLVMGAALERDDIADLECLKEVLAEGGDQISWLQEQISIVNPRTTAILRLSMSGEEAKPIKKIVDAVAEAYLDKVVNQDRTVLLQKVRTLEDQHGRLEDKINTHRISYKNDVDAVSAVDGSTAASQRLFYEEKRMGLQRELNSLRSDILKQELFLKQLKLRDNINPDQHKVELVEQELRKNRQYEQLMAQIQYLQERVNDMEARTKPGTTPKPLQDLIKQLKDADQQVNDLRESIRKAVDDAGIEPAVTREIRLREQDLQVTVTHKDELIKEIEEVDEKLRELKIITPGLQGKKDTLDRMEAVSNQVGLQLEKLQLELSLNNSQVTLAQAASLPKMYDSSTRDRFTVMAALAGLALAVAGVSLYEFQFRRLSSPHEMTEGLGMRVMGDVPMLSERHWRLPGMNGANPDSLQGMMDESIDSIRSLLLHSAGYQSVQVIMVTSANSGEGKTTVSSSLAASLGRSGRRTLLIDGDLRRPAVHRMLDLPLDTGLSEVLRGEAAVEEAIRPSRAPGLWVMPAGRCDHESIQSLTSEVLGATLEKLREEFDMIVVDTGPVLSVVDPLLIGQHCDGAIVSVVRRVSQITNVYDTCQRLQNTGIRLLGSVVNGVTGSQISLGYYGYGYGYDDGYGQHEMAEEVADA